MWFRGSTKRFPTLYLVMVLYSHSESSGSMATIGLHPDLSAFTGEVGVNAASSLTGLAPGLDHNPQETISKEPHPNQRFLVRIIWYQDKGAWRQFA